MLGGFLSSSDPESLLLPEEEEEEEESLSESEPLLLLLLGEARRDFLREASSLLDRCGASFARRATTSS